MEHVQLFFTVSDIPTEKQVPVCLSVVGGTTYELLTNLLAYKNPNNKSIKDIATVLKAHCEPKQLMIAERFHFYRQNQAHAESVAVYVAEL